MVFLPWHRAYLIHLEKALQAAIREPQLRLPYWNWMQRATLPASFAEPTYTKGSQTRNNPLYDATRFGPVGQGKPINYQDMGVPSKSEAALISVTRFEQFGGKAPAPNARNSGALESGAHNYIHTAIGYDDATDKVGNMAIGLSPRDPAFLLHHGNIDRLWEVWRNAGQRRANPPDSTWLNHHFAFPRSNDFEFADYKVADLQNTVTSPGDYRYDRERLEEQVVATVSDQVLRRFTLPLSTSISREISGPGLAIELPGNLQDSLSKLPAQTQGSAVVVLEGVPIADRPATINVIAKANGGASVALGAFSTLPVMKGNATEKQNITLPIDDAARQFLSNNKNVTIVGEAAGSRRGQITIDSFSVEVAQ
ncbi:tyrosinase family protein [Tardiphaga alba]|uniref:tyrosinase family protein n=1 Tax=Tardiphaga alba TaxID=340268 RepID=UPI001BA76310|nr:tyrosinase family protein [Tardiphaga alba]